MHRDNAYVNTHPLLRDDLILLAEQLKSTHPDWQLGIQENKIKIELSAKLFFFSDGHLFFVTSKPIWVKYFFKNPCNYNDKYACNLGEWNLIWASQFFQLLVQMGE